jgi:ribosomal protein S18 acetylase RimI-like enzyme
MLIRRSKTADARALARIYVQSWHDTYMGIVPAGYLRTMTVSGFVPMFLNELRNRTAISFIAEQPGDGAIGFISGGRERQNDCIYEGEIYSLYILKRFQRQAIGSSLVLALADAFNRQGIYSMLVWVLKQNPSRKFYEKINGVYLRSGQLPLGGNLLDGVAYGWISTDLLYPDIE